MGEARKTREGRGRREAGWRGWRGSGWLVSSCERVDHQPFAAWRFVLVKTWDVPLGLFHLAIQLGKLAILENLALFKLHCVEFRHPDLVLSSLAAGLSLGTGLVVPGVIVVSPGDGDQPSFHSLFLVLFGTSRLSTQLGSMRRDPPIISPETGEDGVFPEEVVGGR